MAAAELLTEGCPPAVEVLLVKSLDFQNIKASFSLVPRLSSGAGAEKRAWYTLHAHARAWLARHLAHFKVLSHNFANLQLPRLRPRF